MERLEFREEQVQCARKKGIEEEQRVLMALALLGEVILGQRQKRLMENRDAGRITEVAVLKINEANKIRELYRRIGEIPETEKEKEVGKRGEMEEEWEAMGEISEVASANQTDQLEALRFTMKSENANLIIYQPRATPCASAANSADAAGDPIRKPYRIFRIRYAPMHIDTGPPGGATWKRAMS